MSSQLDLDQGGTARSWVNANLGPTIGWVPVPSANVLPITAAGTYNINPSTSFITVNTAGSVTIVLPSAVNPTIAAGAIPGRFVNNPIVIVDIGGFAQASPITIKPFSVSETIMNLTQIQITVNFGGYTLAPNSGQATWNSISP